MTGRARLVRRAPLLDRVKAYLNPLDFLLWLSEELNSTEWEDFQMQWAYPAGLLLNVVFMIARANSGSGSEADSDIFSDTLESRGSGWLAWLASSVSWLLTLLSFGNAFYTFWRRRHYRLFEANIDVTPSTPSAQRVRVDASPFSSTPLRFLQNTLLPSSAQARAHPDPTRDVWELHVWDPTPLCLRVFCVFSPGHVLIYNLFLPLDPLDARPSVTVATVVTLALLITSQLLLLQGSFSQQIKDTAVIQKEVQSEYDKKFVQPLIYHPVRDAGTQIMTPGTPSKTHEVLVSTPKTFVNRGFHTNPNQNYAKHYDPDAYNTPQAVSQALNQRVPRSVSSPAFQSPLGSKDFSSPSKQPAMRSSGAGDGGHFGVYSHAQSPLKKTVSVHTPPQPSAHSSGSRIGGGQTSPQKRIGAQANGTPASGHRLAHLRGDGIKRDSNRF